MGGFESFLKAIPEAAKSPYSLIAYAVSALIFIVSAARLSQLKKKTAELILTRIDSVDPRERKQVIDGILGTILPPKINGDQYLHSQRMRFVFLAFMGLLAMVGTITVIALINSSRTSVQVPVPSPGPTPEAAKIRVQLWPRPAIKTRFLRDNDARLYLKTETGQLDLKTFVPQDDFLDETTEVDPSLLGKAVEITIGPRDKYRIVQSQRRYLTHIVRLEVYPMGNRPVPPILASVQTPSGERVLRTTDLPINTEVAAVNVSLTEKGEGSFSSPVGAVCPHILKIRGSNLSVYTKLDIVDAMDRQVEGGWAGNEPGIANSWPAEVSQDGSYLKAYFAIPNEPAGGKLFLRVRNTSTKTPYAMIPIHWTNSCSEQ